MNIKTIALIVTYNPNLLELKKNIEAIINQVNELIIIDNNSNNIDESEKIIKKYNKIFLIKNINNEGIAKAFNQGVKYAIQKGYKYLLTLDQDTTVPNNLIETYEQLLSEIKEDNIAIICPNLNDINLKCKSNTNKSYEEVEECISSGSYINLKICKKIGYFDENMFIDWVDFEYCKRVRMYGYKIIRINNVEILHQVGRAEEVKFLWRKEIIYNHNSIRKYYYFRNRIYFAKKYNLTIYKNFSYFRNLLKNFLLIFKEKENKIKKIISALKGIYDGINMKVN